MKLRMQMQVLLFITFKVVWLCETLLRVPTWTPMEVEVGVEEYKRGRSSSHTSVVIG